MNMLKLPHVALLGLTIAGLSWAGFATQVGAAQGSGGEAFGTAAGGQATTPDDKTVIFDQLPLYSLKECPVSGEPLGSMGDPVDMVVDGRLVRLCCGPCKKGVTAKKDAIIAKLDAAAIKSQKKSWPLKSCPISGEALGGDAGPPVEVVWGGRYVEVCCKTCKALYGKKPEKARAKVEAALRAELRKSYPGTTCPVSGETLGSMGEPVEVLYGTQLIRLCCKGCLKSFTKNPRKLVAKVYGVSK